jgi:hypothetical protein
MHAIRNDWNMPHLVVQQTLVVDSRFSYSNLCFRQLLGIPAMETMASLPLPHRKLPETCSEEADLKVVVVM